ncbi:hypothetical protein HETIRDRAFT_410425 [Heterobasidion irregulare TC 32-1]|uniref:Uncharacterized protein n=1 Tax=Heterobasidion irregulare (strain TC 32-1) TaxID=747525 RepID=W4K1M9_HETIT|nr:uncharacterized protein HETIRDRAFT_410425 [Heterobasidion irregulare TC 32-1]ETW79728.1 hypothetical protein HETIRDRAFT_410425 [Heterobasidion irregulare TC 32-1]
MRGQESIVAKTERESAGPVLALVPARMGGRIASDAERKTQFFLCRWTSSGRANSSLGPRLFPAPVPRLETGGDAC